MKKISIFFVLTVFFACTSLLFGQSQIQSGKFNANSSSKGYILDKNSGERTYTSEITFDKPFDKKPNVILSIAMIDADTKSNVRYNVEATSISRDGFTLKISTWSDTKIFGISGSWLAHID